MPENKVQEWIEEVERRWLPDLKGYIESEFKTVFLPSHDHLHHLRVWHILREMLLKVADFNNYIDFQLVEGALIAALFHDLGMVRTTSREHGLISRNLCEAYFNRLDGPVPSHLPEILIAIEVHDRKGDYGFPLVMVDERPSLDTLLTVADDLDALGTIGIYRYAEIYLHRSIPLDKLGMEVLENLTERFANLHRTCHTCPSLLNKYKPLYSEVISFYDRYNQQILSDPSPETTESGHIAVVNLINNLSIQKKISPERFKDFVSFEKNGRVVNDFFNKLSNDYQEYLQDFYGPLPS